MSVRCSRAALASFPASSASSSAVHRPSFGRGWTSRSYANDVAPDRTTLRTVFRDTRRSRAISLIALPLRKYSRRIRPIVSTVSIPHYPRLIRRGQRITPHGRGGNFGRRYPRSGGQDCTPKHSEGACGDELARCLQRERRTASAPDEGVRADGPQGEPADEEYRARNGTWPERQWHSVRQEPVAEPRQSDHARGEEEERVEP